MNVSTAIFVGILAACSLALLFFYRRAWIALRGMALTPTGAGALLSVAFLLGSLFAGPSRDILIAFVIVIVATFIYWIDDLIELSARLRLALSFLVGTSLCAVLGQSGSGSIGLVFLACFVAGALNVVLTNIVNFYDGADLNLATFIALTALFVLGFVPASSPLWFAALASLAFIVPFAFLNSRPQTIYLGDGGSFAFACFLTILAITYFQEGNVPAEIVIPLGLPALDTFYVFSIRVIEKHDLMTRNYLHLYQKLNGRFFRFSYLLPQIINAALVLAFAFLFQRAGWSDLTSVMVAGFIVTPAFYFGCRKVLLPPRVRGSVH